MHRVTGSCLREHIASRADMESGNWKLEGIQRDAVFKGGKYHDICLYSLLEGEYQQNCMNPMSDLDRIKKYVAIAKRIKAELKEI
jgi:hypothetical protein